MPTVTLPAAGAPRAAAHARLVAGGLVLDLPWWPSTITASGEPPKWNEIERPGRKPLLIRQAEGLAERRVSMVIATRSADGRNATSVENSCQATLNTIAKIASHLQPASLILGARNTGRWRITDMSVTELEWTSTGDVSRAEVSLTLKAASDAEVPIGPIKKRK